MSKITITFELEFENSVTEADKMATLHKIDECIATLEPVEIFTKRTVFASFPPAIKSPWKTVPIQIDNNKNLKF